jgi:predicted phage terminase large subunit-like protein
MLEETVLRNPYIPISPTSKQAIFLSLPVLEAFYGGATRGGKTYSLLMAALQFVHVPGYRALLLRRTYTELAKANCLMDLAQQWLAKFIGDANNPVEWSGQQHRWTFLKTGATIDFGYMDAPNDRFKYKSASYTFCGFDEATEFEERDYTYLFSRLSRPKGFPVPLRMRAASNPDGIGRGWVKSRFVTCDYQKTGRIFVPARLEDNPHEDQEAYDRNLRNLNPTTYQQLRYGDWDAKESGKMFRREWFEIVDAAPAKSSKCRFWDFAATADGGDYTVGVLMSRSADSIYYVEDLIRVQYGPSDVDKLVMQTAMMDGRRVRLRWEVEPGATSRYFTADLMKRLGGFDCGGVPAVHKKIFNWRPLAAQAGAGNIKLVQGRWNGEFLDEMESVPNTDGHDDVADGSAGAFNELAVNMRAYGDYGVTA